MIYDETLCRKVKEGFANEKEILAVLEYDGSYLQYVRSQTQEMQKVAVTQNSYALKFISNPSDELLMIAVEQSPSAAEYISKPTRDQIKIMLFANPNAVRFITNGIKKSDWVSCTKKSPSLMKYIPRQFITEDVCTAVGTADYTKIRLIPSQYINNKMSMEFVKANPLALQYLDEETTSDSVKMEAICREPAAAKYIKTITNIDNLIICINNNEKIINYLCDDVLRKVTKTYRFRYLDKKFDI